MNERERIIRTLKGEPTDTIPWTTRLNVWHTSRLRTGTLPAEWEGVDLMEIHRRLKIGRRLSARLIATRLRGVQMTITFNGVVVKEETDPVLSFPAPLELIEVKPGDTVITFETPVGKAQIRYRMIEELIRGAASPYLMEHILKDDDDFAVVKWILEHTETEPSFEAFEAAEAQLEGHGFTFGSIERVPFQRLVIDFYGIERAFYELVDNPERFHTLLELLTDLGREAVEVGLQSPALQLQMGDNFEGSFTSPRLFRKYCMPFLQEVADRIHAQGRFLGSHMDGNLKPLLHLLPECGVDVVESFSPAPLTALTFEEAWEAWRGKLLIWGGIPSPILEQPVPESEFRAWVSRMLALIGSDGRIVLGIGDQAVGPSLIGRVRQISEMLGRL